MRQRRDAREQRLVHRLARDEQVYRLDPRLPRGPHEILALRGEEPRRLPVLALPEQLADELERLVVT